jgi:hypothetical protein
VPSVKSYRSRKHEIEVLKTRVRVLEAQLNQEQNHEAEFRKQAREIVALKTAERLHQVTIQTQSQFLDALSTANDELECRIRIYRDYIRNGELDLGCGLPPPGWICTRIPGHNGPCATVQNIDIHRAINIPAGLKPLDALEYIGKKIEDGFDNISQLLS